jgi:hypothetical protein
MMDEKNAYSRRDFLKIIGISASGAMLTINGAFASQTPDGPDLKLEHWIEAGKMLPVTASTSYLEVLSLKMKPKTHRTRFMVLLRFTDRSVRGAKIHLSLFDKKGSSVGEVTHVEMIGPEEVRSIIAKGDHMVNRWDDTRGVWLTFPKDAKEAVRFKLEISAVN